MRKVMMAMLMGLALVGCVRVEVHATAENKQARADAGMQAGYGAGGAMAAVSDDQSTATATRDAKTVEALGIAGIGVGSAAVAAGMVP